MKEYLGDRVYVEYKDGDIILMATRATKQNDVIVLKPKIFKKLVDFTRKVQEEENGS